MILYNVTVILDDEIHTDWLNWVQQQHIPEVMKTSCFVSSRLLKVLDSPNEGITYCIQYVAETQEKYDLYILQFAPALRASYPSRFSDKFVIYRTLMQFID
ncbi:MAG: DUF4286 family protein [Flavobacterium sp.]|nr:DUF4286 family protein [Pedobacter sp.]